MEKLLELVKTLISIPLIVLMIIYDEWFRSGK